MPPRSRARPSTDTCRSEGGRIRSTFRNAGKIGAFSSVSNAFAYSITGPEKSNRGSSRRERTTASALERTFRVTG
ncbi:hypothetical protein BH23GEM6_BH23GEM6_23930 [soil metagenome]